MSGWTAALLGLLVVLNPPGVSHAVAWGDRSDPAVRRSTLRTVIVATVVLAGLVLLTGPILEVLDISTPTFRLGAAVVMGLSGGRWLLAPPAPITESGGTSGADLAIGLTLLLGPGPVFAAMAGGADGGIVAGLVSVAITMAAAAALLVVPRIGDPVGGTIARLLGAAAVVIAVAIGLDSARSV